MDGFVEKKRIQLRIPVYFFFVCDTSGETEHSRKSSRINFIDIVNDKIPTTITTLGRLLDQEAGYKGFIRVLTYAKNPEWINLDNISPGSYVWNKVYGHGESNLGAAFIRLAKSLRLRESRGLMRRDGPLPIIILILNSNPLDNWELGLSMLNEQFWGARAIRFVVAPDSFNHEVISRFLEMNDNHSHFLSIDQIDKLPSHIFECLIQR